MTKTNDYLQTQTCTVSTVQLHCTDPCTMIEKQHVYCPQLIKLLTESNM